jgi:hypothetical protein
MSRRKHASALDVAMSACVRERANWTCQRCGHHDTAGPELGKSSELQSSHIAGSQHNATRWFPSNMLCLCANCHGFVESRPVAHAELVRWTLAPYWRELNAEVGHRKPGQYAPTKPQRRVMAVHYRAEFARMRAIRAATGFGGLIAFACYEDSAASQYPPEPQEPVF